MAKRRYICWDLDETIGCLRSPEANKVMRGLPKKRGLTKGIRGLLERLRGQDISNVITTAAPKEYTNDVLGKYGLASHFEHVFGPDVLCSDGLDKNYLPVASALGIPAQEAGDRMLIIGNTDRDGPSDSDLVFILHPSAIEYHSSVMGTVIFAMLECESWWWGFETLLTGPNKPITTGCFEGGLHTIDDVEFIVGKLLSLPWTDKSIEHFILIAGASDDYKAELEN
jgi:hypothetical protein